MILVANVAGAIGGRLRRVRNRNELIYVEYAGSIDLVDIDSGKTKALGSGYAELEDIVLTHNNKLAYVSERGGTIYALDATQKRWDKADAKPLITGLAAPHQLALHEAKQRLYVACYGNNSLLSINLRDHSVKIIAFLPGKPIGLVLSSDFKTAYLTLNDIGTVVAVDLASANVTTLATGLTAPFMLSWADSQQGTLILSERDPVHRIRTYDINSGQIQATSLQGIPFRPSLALVSDNQLLINANDVIATFDISEGLVAYVKLLLADSMPFLHTYQRVQVDLSHSGGKTMQDLVFRLSNGDGGGRISLAQDAGVVSETPEIMLLVGNQLGGHKLEVYEASSGIQLGYEAFTITDVYPDTDAGPCRWAQGELQHFVTGNTWGGGPSTPQNVDIIPASGTRRICIVMVDTSSARFPTGTGYNTIRDTWANEAVNGVTGTDGVTRSTRRYFEEISYGNLSLALVGGQVFGPANLPNDWNSYFLIRGTGPDFNPNTSFAPAVVAAANALVDGAGNRLIDFTQIQSLIMVVFSNGANFVWPQAWGDTFNITRLDGSTSSVSFPILVMPHDWNPTHDQRTIHETLAHELGHNLGLPDLYDLGYSTAIANRILDNFDLMSQENPLSHINIGHRMMLGWTRPEWVRTFNFSSGGAVDQTITLHAAELGSPPMGRLAAAEIRIANGWNYYFEYRAGQVSQIGDRQLGTVNRTANQAVLGTDVLTPSFSAPYTRPQVMRLRPDPEAEDSFFLTGQDYKETDTSSAFAPTDFRMDVVSTAWDNAVIRIRYGVNARPDPSIRPWPGGNIWQSPDIEVRNERSSTRTEWFNTPWPNKRNTVVAKVRNRGAIMAPNVRVDFFVKDFTIGGAPEFPLGSDVKNVPLGDTPTEFTTEWIPPGEGHFCIIARIPLYQDPGNPAIVELTQLNNEAQSNYTHFIPASASPSAREVTEIALHNPYPQRARIAMIPQQHGRFADYYRVYVEHTELWLEPNETRKVKVMFESLAGIPEVMARLRKTQQLANFYELDNHVNFVGYGWNPLDKHLHAPQILGGAQVSLRSGRATHFEFFRGDKQFVEGRVLTTDNQSPAYGEVIITFLPEGNVEKSQSLTVTLNEQGYFSSKEFFRRWHGLLPDGIVQADYLGAYQLAPSQAELKL